jgi:hypothetical protein
MTDAEPPMPTGTTVAPVRAARKALALGEEDEDLPGVEDLLGPA